MNSEFCFYYIILMLKICRCHPILLRNGIMVSHLFAHKRRQLH